MQNYICEGNLIEIVAQEAINSGDVVVAGGLIGVAVTSAVIGDTVAVRVAGVFSLAKVAATAINQGDLVYWDATAGNVTKTATDNTQLGYAYLGAQAADTTVMVKLWAA